MYNIYYNIIKNAYFNSVLNNANRPICIVWFYSLPISHEGIGSD